MSQVPVPFRALRQTQLKRLLELIGARRTGTKPQLTARLHQQTQTGPRIQFENGKARLLSIDMGIRNMAFCVADVEQCRSPSKGKSVAPLRVNVLAWKRIDISKYGFAGAAPLDVPEGEGGELSKAESEPDTESFSPRTLATSSYSLLKEVLLPHEPKTILIERQRYRSGGASAVLEWTLRVNLLEGMLYACLETMKQEIIRGTNSKSTTFPEVSGVSPQRVASFWVDPTSRSSSEAKKSTRKIEKKDKINLVHDWLSQLESGNAADGIEIGTKLNESSILLGFSGEAEETMRAFRARNNAADSVVSGDVGRKKKAIRKLPSEKDKLGKLDDLADCLLQATAWIAWEVNKARIAEADATMLGSMAKIEDHSKFFELLEASSEN